jgi:hypothetical protein
MKTRESKQIKNIDTQEHGLKGIEDIDNDIKNFIGEVSNEKAKAEDAVENLIHKETEFIEDAKAQTDKNIYELNNKRSDLEKVVKSKLDLASESIKKSVDILKQNHTYLVKYYKKSLIIPFIALIFLAVLYDNITVSVPWINYAVYGFPVVKVSLVIIMLCYTLYSFHKLSNSFYINSEHLEKNRDIIDEIKPSIKEISISTQKYDETRPIFDSTKETLETLIYTFGKSAPLVSDVFRELNLLAKYKKMVESFELALNYYGLLENNKFFINLRRPPSDIQLIDEDNVWETIIAQKIADELKKRGMSTSKNIILILYREHNGFDTKNIFRYMSDSEDEFVNLSKILIKSGRLVKPPMDVTYKPEDLVSIFKRVGSFDISEINDLLFNSLRKLDYLKAYVEFLDKNGVNPHFIPDIEFIIKEHIDNSIPFEEQVVKLTYIVGMKIFGEISTLNNESADGFARASISIKFHDEISLREYACKFSAKKYATAVLRAYYEKAKEKDRRKVVSIRELLSNLELVSNMLDNNEEDPTFIFLETQLREGTWYDSSASYLKDFIETKAEEIKEQIADIGNFKILKEAVSMAFQNVNIDTVEKAIDAQVFSAYMILSDSSEGNLMELVDLLSIRSSNSKKRWEIKSDDEIKMMEERYGVRQKYDFIKFSTSTRIGVLDKGIPFLDFQNNFITDLKKILIDKNEKFNIGLVIQRITPSKYSFGILDENELYNNIDVKNLNVIRYIALLARDHVSIEEQACITKFDKNIDLLKILDVKSFYEIISADINDIEPYEKRIFESQGFKDMLIGTLNEDGISNLKSLAIDLGHKRFVKANISQIIENVFDNSFSSLPISRKKAKNRANILSMRMVDALEKLAHLYESQRK